MASLYRWLLDKPHAFGNDSDAHNHYHVGSFCMYVGFPIEGFFLFFFGKLLELAKLFCVLFRSDVCLLVNETF